ncbi:MAG: valine--tRNA ligase [Alphaproteobacteria bacterium]|nr:valine--tRNA ligase [Alphaproteobacteria bacterium]
MLDKTFDPESIEQKHYKDWEEAGVFACDPQSEKQPYTIMMPPPNVTGSLHIGHALNHTLQDILIRYHRMKGRDALWQPGTDHASIAVHMVLEKQFHEQGITRFDLGREKFMEKAWEWKEYSGNTITSQLRRLGTTPDWEREAFTMDEGLSRAVLKSFIELYKGGMIYQAERLVNWDSERQTVISDLEVIHKEVNGKLYHVQYPLEDGGYIAIATTRPETILADGAIAVHPDDEKYTHLVGKKAIVPICNRIIPIIADEYVKSEFGSGAVKITAAHDYNDFEVYERHKGKIDIPLINLMNPDGTMNENCPSDYVGLDRFEARKKIIADLDDLGYLEKIEDRKHQVPYGERSDVVIEPFLTKQWFVDTPTLAKEASKAVRDGRTRFIPQQYENMYFAWVDHQLPWCISRQLWWGHQIPAWYDKDGNVYVAENEEDAQAQAGEGIKITRDEDVLDTWFSSALWPFSTIGWPDKTIELERYFPGDVLVTGFDIITFWVSRMMMFSLYLMDDVPFKDIYIHALVRDAKGQKMSKSKGNVMDPIDLIEKYGTDAVRFTLCAMAAQGRDIRLSEERLDGYRHFATKLWNATRYCEMNNCLTKQALDESFDPARVTYAPNKWIVHEVKRVAEEIDHTLETYRFNESANVIYGFVWGTFCDWYLEICKPVLQTNRTQTDEARKTTGWALKQILTMLNPFMPFITEELYAAFFKKNESDRLITSAWPSYPDSHICDTAKEELNWLQDMIGEIRSLRADMNVPAGAQIDVFVKDASDITQERIKLYNEVLCKMARLENVGCTDDIPTGAVQTIIGEATIILPIADFIDLSAEQTRLAKVIGKLDTDVKKIDAKLNNEKFIQNAPEEIIAEQKSRKEEALTKREKLANALKQLESVE